MPNIYQYHRLPDLKLDFYYQEIEVDHIEDLDNTLNDSERDKLLIHLPSQYSEEARIIK